MMTFARSNDEEIHGSISNRSDTRSRIDRCRTWLSEFFFPEQQRLTGRPLVIVSAISVLFVLISYPLLLGWRAFPTAGDLVWAEDGEIFLSDALNHPLTSTLLQPYAGYALVVPRLLARLVVLLPGAEWALGVALASITVRALLAVFVWHALSGAIPGRLARAAVSVTVITIPLGGMEVLNNLANLHWFLLFACFPAMVWRPFSWFGIAMQCIVAASAILTDPLALACLPIALLRFISLHRFREYLVSIVFVIGSVLQLSVVVSTTRTQSGEMTLPEIALAYVVRVAQTAFAGIEIPEWAWDSARGVGIMITIIVVGGILIAGLLCRGPHRGLILFTFGGSVVVYGAAIGLSASAAYMVPPGPISVYVAGRYAVLGGLLLLTAFIAAFWALLHRSRGARQVVWRPLLLGVAVALTGLYAYGAAQTYGYQMDYGPVLPWPAAIADGLAACEKDPALQTAQVPIDPPPSPVHAWQVLLECSAVRK